MADIKKQTCKLCLNNINDKNFTIIEDCTKDMFDMLLLKHDSFDEASVMCGVCSGKLFAAFEFKSACLHTENTIKTYVCSEEDGLPLDIRDIYVREMENKQLVNTDDQQVCRLCMESVADEFKSVQEMDTVLFRKYIPEINFNFTKNPVICKTCFKSIFKHIGFIEDCFTAQQMKIESSNDNMGTVSIKNEDIKIETAEDTVKMEAVGFEEVLIKSEECEIEMTGKNTDHEASQTHAYKHEECELVNDQQEHRDLLDAKIFKCDECNYRSKYKHNLSNHKLTHRDESEVEVYKCTKCDYKTKLKDHILRHQITHKDVSEVRMYKCGECDFQSKYKKSLKSHYLKHRDVSEVNMYKCDECDFQTKYQKYFKSHRLKHLDVSEVDMYKCDECDYRTKFKEYFKSHRLKHRDASEVKMFKCDECDYQTKHRAPFRRHRLKHSDVSVKMYKCDECDFQTKYKDYLKTHTSLKHRDVSEVKMYKCNECDYRSKYKAPFRNHCLKHTVI